MYGYKSVINKGVIWKQIQEQTLHKICIIWIKLLCLYLPERLIKYIYDHILQKSENRANATYWSINPQTNKNCSRGTTLELSVKILLGGLKPVYSRKTSTLTHCHCSLETPKRAFGRQCRPRSIAGLGGSVGCASDWRPGGRGFDPRRSWQHSFVEIDHEIFSTVILSLPLIQEGQLSVSGERMCTILVNRLEDKACPVNVWLGKLTVLDMTPLGWLGRKTSTQTNKTQIRCCLQTVQPFFSKNIYHIAWHT